MVSLLLYLFYMLVFCYALLELIDEGVYSQDSGKSAYTLLSLDLFLWDYVLCCCYCSFLVGSALLSLLVVMFSSSFLFGFAALES